MQKLVSWLRNGDTLAVFFLCVFPLVYFWRVTLGQAVWFTRDISRMYFPYAVELSRALAEGRLPFWVPNLQAGFPLVADGQVAAFYLPHLILVKLLPPASAISCEMLLHLAWAAVGAYLFVRGIGFRRTTALLAGFIISFNGYILVRLYHTPILLTAAWLPWLIFLQDQFQRAHRDRRQRAGIWFAVLVLAAGVQWFIGFPQTALMNTMTCGVFGFFGGLFWNHSAVAWRERLQAIPRVVCWAVLPLLLSGGIAAIQIVPTAELISYSMRVQGLSEKYLTMYALTSDWMRQFVIPFAPGEPSDDNVEMWGYIGLTTLIWSIAALGQRRDSRTVFTATFALVTFSLTFGGDNPLFRLLMALPVLNFFRVPARYLLLFGFAAALLCATTFESLTQRAANNGSDKKSIAITFVFAGAVFAVMVLAATQTLGFWFAMWQVLPWILGAAAVIVLGLGWAGKIERGVLSVVMIGLVVFDLSAYAAPLLSTTVATLTTPAYVNQVPRSVPGLGKPGAPERVFTDESIWPSVPALRSSLYPNFGAVYGRESVHVYSPLVFNTAETYFYNLSPAMLNLSNARYFAIPLEPRAAERAATPYSSLAVNAIEDQIAFAPTAATAIQIESFTEGTGKLPEETVAAKLHVAFDDGTTQVFPLRLGIETADWDYALMTTPSAPPAKAQVARSVQSFVRAVGRFFDGYVYRASFDLAPASQSRKVVAISIQPEAVLGTRISVERLALIDETGRMTSVAALSGKNDFALKYMSDTTAIWENLNVLPRAFLVHDAQVIISNDLILGQLQHPDFRADQTVLLQEGQSLSVPAGTDFSSDRVEFTRYQSENITLAVTTEQPGYLVLADSWYPGWNVSVDGKPAPLDRADYMFRAVPIEPGMHTVVFEFRPTAVYVGAAISAATLLVTLGIAIVIGRGKSDR